MVLIRVYRGRGLTAGVSCSWVRTQPAKLEEVEWSLTESAGVSFRLTGKASAHAGEAPETASARRARYGWRNSESEDSDERFEVWAAVGGALMILGALASYSVARAGHTLDDEDC